MKALRRVLIWIGGFVILYLGVCLVFYLAQESFGFNFQKVPPNHIFQCDKNFTELSIKTLDGFNLNGVLIKADTSKGLILFLHGSGGNIDRYIKSVPIYAQLGYDLFFLDYRGYGKSEGKMKNEKQFTEDLDCVYAYMKTMYEEKNIVIIGFSMGTFAGSYIASKNNPKFLVLESPPYWIAEQFIKKYFFLPISLLTKYKFETYKYARITKTPIAVFFGSEDEANDERWHQILKPGDKLTILEGEGHNDYAFNSQYINELEVLLK